MVAVPARDGTTHLSLTSPQAPQQPDTCSLKVSGMGGERGHGHPRGLATTLGTATGTAMGMAVGTAVVPCTPGAYGLRRGDGSQLLALRGTGVGTFPLGTPPLLGVFWGSQDPPAPHGLPGGQGGAGRRQRHQEEMKSSGEGDPSGAAARGRQMVGRGPLVPVPPACCPFTGGQHGRWHKGPPSLQCPETARAGDPAQGLTRTPTPPSPGSARPGAGAGGDRHSCPRAAAPWGGGAGTRDGDAGIGMAPHPVYKRWREETRSQGHVRQRLPWGRALLPAGTNVPKVPRQLPGDPSPTGSETPSERHAGAGGARDPAGSQLGVSAPPARGLGAGALRGDTCPPPCRVPARWRGGQRCRRQGEMRGISGLETRSRRCRG